MPPAAASPPLVTLTEEEIQQIKECEKILRFRDEVLSGSHPRIKIPAHLVIPKPSTNGVSRILSSPAVVAEQTQALRPGAPSSHTVEDVVNSSHAMTNMHSFQANVQHAAIPPTATPSLPGLGSYSNNSSGTTPASKAAARSFGPGSGKVEIDPVLLQKSDDLIKAELQLQRQRLERALRDQLEQQRAATRSLHASEPLADFDLKEVLENALELVQKTAAPPTDLDAAANASREESDSFDDNTFYSSRHDTPEHPQLSRIPNESDESVEVREGSDYEPELIPEPVAALAHPHVGLASPQGARTPRLPQYQQQPTQMATHQPTHPQDGPFTSNNMAAVAQPPHTIPSQESGEASRLRDTRNTNKEQSSDRVRLEAVNERLLDETFSRQESPILRAHNLSPIAPQPAHVSPLAVARQAPSITERDANMAQGTPAQVAALRKDIPSASSPESSPQGKPSRKAKKKKRKADRPALDAGASPCIKPEPRSPSPVSALQFARPPKRQRQLQSQRLASGLDYEESRYQTQPDDRPQIVYREERTPVAYERRDGYYIRQEPRQPVVITEPPRYETEYFDDRRAPEATYIARRPESRTAYSVYSPAEVRPGRSVSQAVVERPYRGPPAYYMDRREPSRASVRPVLDRDRSRSPVMGPPRAPPARIVVDEFGREYIEPPPPPPSVVRHSVAPSAQSAGETEVIYERTAAIPTVSKMPEADTFQQEGVVYRRVSPGPYSVPRRVMTQPEYVNPDYRAYRQREYSIRPMAPADGYIQVRGATESRPSDAPREYMTRAMSVRPAEPIRYEAPAEYGARVQSVRPEPILREYASSLRSDHRREIAQTPTPREYSMRTGEVPQVIRREYSVRPVEPPQYCERPVRGDEGMTYIERPRGAPQENIYDDGVQRPVYR